MKKSSYLFLLATLLSSCQATTFYQICKVESELPTSASGAYEYKGTDCDISYDFWSDGGAVKFTVVNNTDELLYMDMTKSFFIKNGVAYDYFQNRTISSGISVASQNASSCTYEEKEIAVIPPHASKVFSEYTIMSKHFTDCDLLESPGKKERAEMSFDVSSTPVQFVNYLCYRVGEDRSNQFVKNTFYVSEICNQHHDVTFHKIATGCPSDVYRPMEYVFVRTSPKEFYVSYLPRVQKLGTGKKKLSKDEVYGF